MGKPPSLTGTACGRSGPAACSPATDEPVSAVADRLGFSSVYAFSRFFRARTGQSPTACRREARP